MPWLLYYYIYTSTAIHVWYFPKNDLKLYNILGSCDYAKPVNTQLWYHLMLYEAHPPPKFHTSAFQWQCDTYQAGLG